MTIITNKQVLNKIFISSSIAVLPAYILILIGIVTCFINCSLTILLGSLVYTYVLLPLCGGLSFIYLYRALRSLSVRQSGLITTLSLLTITCASFLSLVFLDEVIKAGYSGLIATGVYLFCLYFIITTGYYLLFGKFFKD